MRHLLEVRRHSGCVAAVVHVVELEIDHVLDRVPVRAERAPLAAGEALVLAAVGRACASCAATRTEMTAATPTATARFRLAFMANTPFGSASVGTAVASSDRPDHADGRPTRGWPSSEGW